jgi:hypothetical protein
MKKKEINLESETKKNSTIRIERGLGIVDHCIKI